MPESFSLALALLIVTGPLLICGLADWTLHRQARATWTERGQQLGDVLASLLSGVEPDAALTLTLPSMLDRQSSVRSVVWTDADEQVRFRWALTAIDESAVPGPRRGGDFVAPVRDVDGAPRGSVRVTLVRPDRPLQSSIMWTLGALTTGAALLGYLVFYRRLRSHVRAAEAVEHSLESYASGLERELQTLRLSESLGEPAAWWNKLLADMAELSEQVTKASTPDVTRSALSRFENRALRIMLDRLPIGVVTYSADRTIRYANAAAARLLGETDELTGRDVTAVVGDSCWSSLVDAGPSGWVDHERNGTSQPRVLRLASLGALAEGGADRLLVVQDVTHLQEAQRARDDFLYHVTHELRTPLTNIQAYTETLAGPEFVDEQLRKECYNVIISETRRLSKLVEDILNLSQLEVGSLQVDWSDVDLARLVRSMVQDNQGRADEKNIALTLQLPPKIPHIRGDKQRLAVLLQNLIGNAIKYTHENGKVSVTLEPAPDRVRLAVSDTGIGIPEADQPHVFDKFYRSTSGDVQAVTGTGLGLAIARETARLHGGGIELQSELGKGSTFIVDLPVNQTADIA